MIEELYKLTMAMLSIFMSISAIVFIFKGMFFEGWTFMALAGLLLKDEKTCKR